MNDFDYHNNLHMKCFLRHAVTIESQVKQKYYFRVSGNYNITYFKYQLQPHDNVIHRHVSVLVSGIMCLAWLQVWYMIKAWIR